MVTPDSEQPHIGDFAHDIRRDTYGVIMDQIGKRFFLRPMGGGREWEAEADDVRTARVSDMLGERIAMANSWSSSRNDARPG